MLRNREDIVGDHIKSTKSGEHIFECLSCGKPKLYVNSSSGLFHCFSCGIGGKCTNFVGWPVGGMTWISPPQAAPVEVFQTVSALVKHYENKNKPHAVVINYPPWKEGKIDLAESLLVSRGVSPRIFEECTGLVFSLDDGYFLGLPLRASNGYCGLALRSFTDHRFYTYMQRGIALSQSVATTIGGPTHLVLAEGFFDYLSLVEGIQHPNVWVAYTAGNQLTPEQVAYLTQDHYDYIHIAYDNDKIQPPINILHRLSVLTDARITRALPPKDLGKDWNDAWNQYPNRSEEYWKNALREV